MCSTKGRIRPKFGTFLALFLKEKEVFLLSKLYLKNKPRRGLNCNLFRISSEIHFIHVLDE